MTQTAEVKDTRTCGAYRFDTTNDTLAILQWGSHLFFKYTSSTLMLSPVDNLDETVQKIGRQSNTHRRPHQ